MDEWVRYKVVYAESADEHGISRKHAEGISVHYDCNILDSIARLNVPSNWTLIGLENCSARNPMGFRSFRRYINELDASYAAEYTERVDRMRRKIKG